MNLLAIDPRIAELGLVDMLSGVTRKFPGRFSIYTSIEMTVLGLRDKSACAPQCIRHSSECVEDAIWASLPHFTLVLPGMKGRRVPRGRCPSRLDGKVPLVYALEIEPAGGSFARACQYRVKRSHVPASGLDLLWAAPRATTQPLHPPVLGVRTGSVCGAVDTAGTVGTGV